MIDEDAAQLQSDLDALWNYTQGSLLKFDSSKCHQLTLTGRSDRPAKVTQEQLNFSDKTQLVKYILMTSRKM